MFRTKEIYENLFIEMHWYFYEQSANSHFTLFHRTEKSALAKVKQYSIASVFLVKHQCDLPFAPVPGGVVLKKL